MILWTALQTILTTLVGPLFTFLNKRTEAKVEIRKSDNRSTNDALDTVTGGIVKADDNNTKVRLAEGKWSPWVVVTIAGFMMPFAWHTWQVVLDSSRWLPAVGWFGFIPYPTVEMHVVGSWHIAALPGMFEVTEHAVIQSLFVGASVAVGAIPVLMAINKMRR